MSVATFYPCIFDTPPFTRDVPGYEPVEGEGIPRRNVDSVSELLSEPEDGISTLWDMVQRNAQKFGDAKAVGSRRPIKTHREIKMVKQMVDGREQDVEKKWTYFELGEYTYLSYNQYERLVRQVGAGFRKLGLVKDDKVFVFAATSARWLAATHGAMSQSMPIVTAYDTLGEDAIRLSVLATRPKAVFLDPALIGTLSKITKSAESIRVVVYNEWQEWKQEDLDKLKAAHPHLVILSFQELSELGEQNLVDPVPPGLEDLACIMYTSGSTGAPKGVLIKHRNVVAAVAGINSVVGKYLGPTDTLIAYLPLAHIFEFALENAAMFWGTTLGYGTSKTLTDTSMKNCKGDMRELKPTLMVGVPAVWESVKKGIVSRIQQQGFVARNVFWAAVASKSWMLSKGIPGWGLWDNIVFGKVREATGGRLRLCANGAGPISRETQRFISMVVTPMILGYGMTEAVGMGALGNPMRWTDAAIGDIPACIEVKLVDYPEAGYFSNRSPPQGEIWLRGNSIMSEFYENDVETAEALTADGWLKTGDIGEWDSVGHLKVIDRKKNLVKTLNGEYIALEKLESVYRSSPVLSNICVYASPQKVKPIALIVPTEPALKKLAAENGIPSSDVKALIDDKNFWDVVHKEVLAAGKKGGLAGIELVSGVVLVHEEWSPQNGLLTSALKLNRRAILGRYKNEIADTFTTNE